MQEEANPLSIELQKEDGRLKRRSRNRHWGGQCLFLLSALEPNAVTFAGASAVTFYRGQCGHTCRFQVLQLGDFTHRTLAIPSFLMFPISSYPFRFCDLEISPIAPLTYPFSRCSQSHPTSSHPARCPKKAGGGSAPSQPTPRSMSEIQVL